MSAWLWLGWKPEAIHFPRRVARKEARDKLLEIHNLVTESRGQVKQGMCVEQWDPEPCPSNERRLPVMCSSNKGSAVRLTSVHPASLIEVIICSGNGCSLGSCSSPQSSCFHCCCADIMNLRSVLGQETCIPGTSVDLRRGVIKNWGFIRGTEDVQLGIALSCVDSWLLTQVWGLSQPSCVERHHFYSLVLPSLP